MEDLTKTAGEATIDKISDPEPAAAPSGAEDASAAYLEIIGRQQDTISQLQEQLAKSESNLAKAIRQGAAFVADEGKNPTPPASAAKPDNYQYLKDLDFDIKKTDYL